MLLDSSVSECSSVSESLLVVSAWPQVAEKIHVDAGSEKLSQCGFALNLNIFIGHQGAIAVAADFLS